MLSRDLAPRVAALPEPQLPSLSCRASGLVCALQVLLTDKKTELLNGTQLRGHQAEPLPPSCLLSPFALDP